jgi:protein-tyrosine phosphatase
MWTLSLGDDLGNLVLMPCPGTKGVSALDTFHSLKLESVDMVITALSDDEMQAKALPPFQIIADETNIIWHQLPIPDDSTPSAQFQTDWALLEPQVLALLSDKRSVALHCMGGSGRTGLLAAHILVALGWSLAEIVEQVQALRPNAFTHPDQRQYIEAVIQN